MIIRNERGTVIAELGPEPAAAWVLEAKLGRYAITAPHGAVLSFTALIKKRAGNVVWTSPGGDSFTLLEGDPDDPMLQVPGDREIYGEEQVPRERIVELVTQLARSAERPDGAEWIASGPDDDHVEDDVDLRTPGPRTEALLAAIAKQRRRKPDAALMQLADECNDDLGFAAFLRAIAEREGYEDAEAGDWMIEAPARRGTAIALGTLTNGDPVAFANGRIVVTSHETGEELASSFEDFLAARAGEPP